MKQCEGNCQPHRGEVVPVRVTYADKDWGDFYYCEAAIEKDQSSGLWVDVLPLHSKGAAMSERSERMTEEQIEIALNGLKADRLKCMDTDEAKRYAKGIQAITQLRSDLATANERVRVAEAKIVGLWKLLDDIDTLDDAAGDSNEDFRNHARRIQRKRFEIVSGEEFDALLSRLPADAGEGE